jgi:hypothetical protein
MPSRWRPRRDHNPPGAAGARSPGGLWAQDAHKPPVGRRRRASGGLWSRATRGAPRRTGHCPHQRSRRSGAAGRRRPQPHRGAAQLGRRAEPAPVAQRPARRRAQLQPQRRPVPGGDRIAPAGDDDPLAAELRPDDARPMQRACVPHASFRVAVPLRLALSVSAPTREPAVQWFVAAGPNGARPSVRLCSRVVPAGSAMAAEGSIRAAAQAARARAVRGMGPTLWAPPRPGTSRTPGLQRRGA